MEKVVVGKMVNIVIIVLLFVAIFSLLSLVYVNTPELPVGETVGQWVWFGKMLLLSLGCIVVACSLQLWQHATWKQVFAFQFFSVYVSWGLITLGALEAILGLRQLYGFAASNHVLYKLTGSFFNPGPYAGYLAMVLPMCLHHYIRVSEKWYCLHRIFKVEKVMALLAGLLVLFVLPATMSRSAWLAAIAGCIWVIYMDNKCKWRVFRERDKWRYLLWGAGLFCIILAVLTGMFLLKPDSALGRLFMWKIIFRALIAHPWGHCEGFAYAYSEAQKSYFLQGDYADWEERVAGSPEYAFNEYLELAVTQGVCLCIAVIAIILVNWWLGKKLKRYGVCGAIISIMVFAVSSYPMHIPAFIVACACLLLACGFGDIVGKALVLFLCLIILIGGINERWEREKDFCREWMQTRTLYETGAYEAANKVYKELYSGLCKKGEFLFEYGLCLHRTGRYDESNICLNKARSYNTDPMLLNIMGKNYQQLHFYEQAEYCFLSSVNCLPGRIYPYYLLAKLYAEPEYRNKEKFKEMERNVLNRKPKVYSMAIEEMRREIVEISESWGVGGSIHNNVEPDL